MVPQTCYSMFWYGSHLEVPKTFHVLICESYTEAEKIHNCLDMCLSSQLVAYTAKFLKQIFVYNSCEPHCFIGKKFCCKNCFLHRSMHILQILSSYNCDCLSLTLCFLHRNMHILQILSSYNCDCLSLTLCLTQLGGWSSWTAMHGWELLCYFGFVLPISIFLGIFQENWLCVCMIQLWYNGDECHATKMKNGGNSIFMIAAGHGEWFSGSWELME